MRCQAVRAIIEKSEAPVFCPSLRQHLDICHSCAAYARDWRLISAGLAELGREPEPEPTWGFATRVLRRIEETVTAAKPQADFFEQVGRRFVYATMVLVLTLLLVLLLPSSGPVRGPASTYLDLVTPEAVTGRSELALSEQYPEWQDVTQWNGLQGGDGRTR